MEVACVLSLLMITRYGRYRDEPRRNASLNPRRKAVPMNRKPEGRTERGYVIGEDGRDAV